MDLSTMTLAEFFALAEKVGGAARTIREAQAMLGGPLTAPVGTRVAVHDGSPLTVTYAPAPPPAPTVQWSAEEQAQRDRLRKEREAAEKAVLESRS